MPKIKNVNHEEHEERLARKRTEKSEDRSQKETGYEICVLGCG